ncbi:hypothetical protein [Hydrogenophaga sp.]|uniref:hypothetical protein n=1 Tax=Hydrogenophaga sp. TaxID=1904254 RepID=UPI003D0D8740
MNPYLFVSIACTWFLMCTFIVWLSQPIGDGFMDQLITSFLGGFLLTAISWILIAAAVGAVYGAWFFITGSHP